MANDIMQEGPKHFAEERVRVTADGIAQLRKDRERAMRKLQEAKEEYTQTHLAKGVAEPQSDLAALQIALADVNRRLQEERAASRSGIWRFPFCSFQHRARRALIPVARGQDSIEQAGVTRE